MAMSHGNVSIRPVYTYGLLYAQFGRSILLQFLILKHFMFDGL